MKLKVLLFAGLLAAGAAALNQVIKRVPDGRMRRTQDRPLPAGRLAPDTVLILGVLLALSDLIYLGGMVGPLPASLGMLTLLVYLGLYPEIVEGLEKTHAGGIRYPVPIYLRFQADYPKSYQDLEKICGRSKEEVPGTFNKIPQFTVYK